MGKGILEHEIFFTFLYFLYKTKNQKAAHQRPFTSHSRISLWATEKRSVPEGEKRHVCSESLCCEKSWNLPLVHLISFNTRSRRTTKGQASGRISVANIREPCVVSGRHVTFWPQRYELTLGREAEACGPVRQSNLFDDLVQVHKKKKAMLLISRSATAAHIRKTGTLFLERL